MGSSLNFFATLIAPVVVTSDDAFKTDLGGGGGFCVWECASVSKTASTDRLTKSSETEDEFWDGRGVSRCFRGLLRERKVADMTEGGKRGVH